MGSIPGHVLQSLKTSYVGNVAEEPYEGKPHVRFNEGPVETQFGWALSVYSTPAIPPASDVAVILQFE